MNITNLAGIPLIPKDIGKRVVLLRGEEQIDMGVIKRVGEDEKRVPYIELANGAYIHWPGFKNYAVVEEESQQGGIGKKLEIRVLFVYGKSERSLKELQRMINEDIPAIIRHASNADAALAHVTVDDQEKNYRLAYYSAEAAKNWIEAGYAGFPLAEHSISFK